MYSAAAATWSSVGTDRRHWAYFMACAISSLLREIMQPMRAPQAENRLETVSMTMTFSAASSNWPMDCSGSPA